MEVDQIVEKASTRFGAVLDPSTFTLKFPKGLKVIDQK